MMMSFGESHFLVIKLSIGHLSQPTNQPYNQQADDDSYIDWLIYVTSHQQPVNIFNWLNNSHNLTAILSIRSSLSLINGIMNP